MPRHRIRDARQDDAARAGGLDPQFVTGPKAGLTECLHGNRCLVLPAQPSLAAHP